MTFAEWRTIGGALFAAFPQNRGTSEREAETLTVYFVDLAEYDERDVGAACTYLRRNAGPFLPSIAEIRRQTEVEGEARVAHERLPDFTGSHALPPAELQRLLDQGNRASEGAPAQPADEEEVRVRRQLASLAEGGE